MPPKGHIQILLKGYKENGIASGKGFGGRQPVVKTSLTLEPV